MHTAFALHREVSGCVRTRQSEPGPRAPGSARRAHEQRAWAVDEVQVVQHSLLRRDVQQVEAGVQAEGLREAAESPNSLDDAASVGPARPQLGVVQPLVETATGTSVAEELGRDVWRVLNSGVRGRDQRGNGCTRQDRDLPCTPWPAS